MKSLAALALALVASSALAQSNPPADVPRDHWAYSSVANLYRLGILKGYPDGTFKGTRPVSRFELAGTIDATYSLLRADVDRVREQIQAGRPSSASVEELAALRRQMDSLRSDVATLNALRPEVDSLSRDFGSLSEQLRKIRADLESMRGSMPKPRG